MFSFSSGLSSGSNTICYRLFFSAIELLWDRWQISTDHICTDFLLDSLFCSVNHLICLLFHQGHAVLILVASFVVVQLPSHVYCLPHHEPHHARLPCLSLSPRACSNPCPLSQWWHPTISSSITPFSSCPQSFQALGSFPMSWLFTSDGQSTGASASAPVLPMNIQGWSPLGLTGLISKGLSRLFSSTTVWKHQFFGDWLSAFFMVQFSHPYMTTGKTSALTAQTFVSKGISLLFNTLSRFVIEIDLWFLCLF